MQQQPGWDEGWQDLDPDCEDGLDGSFAVTEGMPSARCALILDQQADVLLCAGPTVCVLNVTGADSWDVVDLRQGGSLDGVYKAFSCMDGHPAFYRLDSPEDGAARQLAAAVCWGGGTVLSGVWVSLQRSACYGTARRTSTGTSTQGWCRSLRRCWPSHHCPAGLQAHLSLSAPLAPPLRLL